MKKYVFALALLVASGASASAQNGIMQQNLGGTYNYGTGSNPNKHYVQPHTNQNGSNVPGHYQTNPNNTQLDNYGTRRKVNPYTGQIGTRSLRY